MTQLRCKSCGTVGYVYNAKGREWSCPSCNQQKVLTPEEETVLGVLRSSPDISARGIARRMGQGRKRISECLHRLASKGKVIPGNGKPNGKLVML